MAAEAGLEFAERPDGYRPPDWETVSPLAETLKQRRQPVIDRIWQVKRVRRGQWDDVIQKIPAAYRQMLVSPDLPVVRDMIQRVSGLIAKQEPMPQVIPSSPRSEVVRAASREEARLHALRIQIEDQQDRPTWAMGIDSQAAWGESWISVMPDSRRLSSRDFERSKGEEPKAYGERYAKAQLKYGVPLRMDDWDPQSVYPHWADGKLPLVIVQTEHAVIDVNIGLGYQALRDKETGKTKEWVRGSLTEPYVQASDVADVGTASHNRLGPVRPTSSGATGLGKPVMSTIYLDCWVYQRYLDGILVEQWEHDMGFVPMVPAYGEQTSDRDPAYASVGIADAAIALARQVVMFAAIMASNAMQHGFPTPFLKNPISGLVDAQGNPIVRQVAFGDLNVLGQGEEIEFPFLNAQMMPDFYRHLDWLSSQLEGATLSNFGKAIGSDIAGYAIAQIRSMQMSILSTIYSNAARQWRKLFYIYRHLIRTEYPGGIYLRGAIEEEEKGDGSSIEYAPVLEYAKEHCTDDPIQVLIDEGIAQDEIAMEKMAIEKMQAGLWSPRRAMESVGIEDPDAEQREIDMHRIRRSPSADEMVLAMAAEIAAKRWAASEQMKATPFMRALEQAKQQMLGTGAPAPSGGGTFANQQAFPQNADAATQTPLNQVPGQTAPGGGQVPAQAPGAATRGPSMSGQQTQPGGAAGVQQTPAGAPG